MLESLNKIYNVGIYIRLSREDDDKQMMSESITNQKSLLLQYVKENNLRVYDIYIDDGYSGTNFDRPDFNRLLNDIELGRINMVITKDMSRLGRDYIGTGNLIEKYFPEHNVRYIAILDNYDTLSPNGMEDILPFKAVINDMYIKDISKKIKSVRHEKMEKGLFVGSSVTYGYKRSEEDNRKLVIDEYSAGIVKRIFDMKDNGITNNMIARTLTNEGILPPDVYSGKKLKKITVTTNLWKASSIKTILSNEAYIGNLIQGKYERVSLKSKKKRLLPKSKWVIKKGAIPPIISKELFDKVNTPKRKMDTRFRQYDYLLKGLVVCADCGKTMLVRRVKSQSDPSKIHAIYVCRTYANYRNNICSMHYYREDALNELVLKEVREVLLKYSQNEQLDKKYKSSICNFNLLENYEKDLAFIKEKIVTIDKAISDLYKDRANGIINSDEFSGIKKELVKDRKECELKVQDLEIILAKSKNILTDEKMKLDYINEFLKSKTPSKEIIKIFINKIEIFENKNIKIHFNFNLDGVSNE